MDSNASTPATQRREHTLLQNLGGHHHHHLVSIQSNISSLRTTLFSILHILLSVSKQYAFLEKKLCSPCEVLLYMYTSHCNVKLIPFDKFNFVKLPVSPRWRTAINIKTLFFCTDFLFFSHVLSPVHPVFS